MGNPASVIRKKTEKRRKRFEERLGPGAYLPKAEREALNAEVAKQAAAEAARKAEVAKKAAAAKEAKKKATAEKKAAPKPPAEAPKA